MVSMIIFYLIHKVSKLIGKKRRKIKNSKKSAKTCENSGKCKKGKHLKYHSKMHTCNYILCHSLFLFFKIKLLETNYSN